MPTWNRDENDGGWSVFYTQFEAFAARTSKEYNTGAALIYLCDLARGYERAPISMGAEVDPRLVGGSVMRTAASHKTPDGRRESPGSATKPSATDDDGLHEQSALSSKPEGRH